MKAKLSDFYLLDKSRTFSADVNLKPAKLDQIISSFFVVKYPLRKLEYIKYIHKNTQTNYLKVNRVNKHQFQNSTAQS